MKTHIASLAAPLVLLAACASGDRAADAESARSGLPAELGQTTLHDVVQQRGDPVQEAALDGRIHYYYGEHTFFFGPDSVVVGVRIADSKSRGEIEQLFGIPGREIRRANHALWVQYQDSVGVLYDSAGQRSRFIEYMLSGHTIRLSPADSTS